MKKVKLEMIKGLQSFNEMGRIPQMMKKYIAYRRAIVFRRNRKSGFFPGYERRT